jgi:hypothetical protein
LRLAISSKVTVPPEKEKKEGFPVEGRQIESHAKRGKRVLKRIYHPSQDGPFLLKLDPKVIGWKYLSFKVARLNREQTLEDHTKSDEIGKRIPLTYTRAILDSIHSGAMARSPMWRDPVFGLDVVIECPGVPSEILRPRETWANKAGYDASANKLAELFIENFKKYQDGTDPEIKAGSPVPRQL